MSNLNACPCCSTLPYDDCCGRYLTLGAYPQTAEQVMRSRFTAYTLANIQYLKKTWHPDTYPKLNLEELTSTHWHSLEVVNHKPGLKKSIVEFKAYYQQGNNIECLHEVSVFKKQKNRWVYVEAEQIY